MKSKLSLFTILGLAACCWAGFAQNNEPAPKGDNNTAGDQVQPATPPATDPAAAKPDTAPAPDAAAANKAAEAPAGNLVAANEQPKADAPKADATAATTNAPAGSNAGAVIPLIVMDDVPLTDAIKNLARQAGLNYMLDPKISFGQPGPDGKPVPQPTVSIRWENVSAEQALNAMLGNYDLQLSEDPKSKIARIIHKD